MILSLHVNLGAPPEFTTEIFNKYRAETDLLTDVLTYGYSSPERVRLRKTNVSHVGTKDTVQSSAKSKNARTSELIRLEIRSGEFRDFPTYRMIAESQRLGAMMFAYMKQQEHMPMTEQEIELANLWDEFSQEATQELQPIINGRPNLYDWEKELAANLIETTDIKHICRETGTKYSVRAAKVLEVVH